MKKTFSGSGHKGPYKGPRNHHQGRRDGKPGGKRPPQPGDRPALKLAGVIVMNPRGYPEIKPADKKANFNFNIRREDMKGAKEGDVVGFTVSETKKGDHVAIVKILGRHDDPKILSRISIYESDLRKEFPPEVQAETKNMTVPEVGKRMDLRAIPLVTIDGSDARDFDDAVFAEETNDGFHLIVAIADVAHYVRPGSALDEEAYMRGNSTYLPDRVLPMLPEALSNDLCSLRPHEDRACMAVHMWIDKKGHMTRHQFVRGLMRSQARLTYEQVQAAYDGAPNELTAPLMDHVIGPLYKAFGALWSARETRGVMDLDMPERRVMIDENNRMTGVKKRDRLKSHQLIEEFMILANVAAGAELTKRGAPCVYRVHDKPDPVKIESVMEFVRALGLKLPIGEIKTAGQLNEILKASRDVLNGDLLDAVLLRAQRKAVYSIENIEHFGLALMVYAHFTSPIRRYSDLLVHRLLIRSLDLGDGAMTDGQATRLEEMADHISQTERASADAERRTIDRFTASYHTPDIEKIFRARIRGVSSAGLFVELPETGADVFIPRRLLPHDFYQHHETQHALIGERSGRVFRLGGHIDVKLLETDAISGNMIGALEGESGGDLEGLSFAKRSSRPDDRRPDKSKPKSKKNQGRRKPGKKR